MKQKDEKLKKYTPKQWEKMKKQWEKRDADKVADHQRRIGVTVKPVVHDWRLSNLPAPAASKRTPPSAAEQKETKRIIRDARDESEGINKSLISRWDHENNCPVICRGVAEGAIKSFQDNKNIEEFRSLLSSPDVQGQEKRIIIQECGRLIPEMVQKSKDSLATQMIQLVAASAKDKDMILEESSYIFQDRDEEAGSNKQPKSKRTKVDNLVILTLYSAQEKLVTDKQKHPAQLIRDTINYFIVNKDYVTEQTERLMCLPELKSFAQLSVASS